MKKQTINQDSYATNFIRSQRIVGIYMVATPVIVLLGVFLVALLSLKGNGVKASVLLSNNFENGLGWSTQSVGADRLKTVTTTDNGKTAPQGVKMARFELRQGDNPLAQWCCKTTNRVEFTTSTNEQKGQERWYSWYQMFDTTFPSYDTYPTSQNQGWQIFAQWHGNDDKSPPLAWWAAGDNIVLALGDGTYYTELWRGPMNRGNWINIKMHVFWGDFGSIALWINGVKVIDRTGVDNITSPPLYFKTGMYRPNTLSKKAITYMDDFKMGTSESDLGSLSASPAISMPTTQSTVPNNTSKPSSSETSSTNVSSGNSQTSNSVSKPTIDNSPIFSEPSPKDDDSSTGETASVIGPTQQSDDASIENELQKNEQYYAVHSNKKTVLTKDLFWPLILGSFSILTGLVGYIIIKRPLIIGKFFGLKRF